MKNIKYLKQTTATILLTSLALTSCSKNYSTTIFGAEGTRSNEQKAGENIKTANDFDAWKKLITSDEKNIALAEILSATVARENKDIVSEIVSSLTTEEVDKIISSVQIERTKLGKTYLFRNDTYLEGKAVYRNSILNEGIKISTSSYDSESVQLQVATFAYLKSKSLGEIYASFDKIMEDSSRVVAKAMAITIAEKNPALAHELESAAANSATKEEFTEKVKASKNYLALAEEMFQYSVVNTKEQLAAVATGAVAGLLYLEIKENKTFKDILKKYEELKPKIEEIKKNIDTIKLTVAVIKKNKDDANLNLKDFNEGLSGLKTGIKETFDTAKTAIEGNDPKNGKKTAQFIYDKVIKGKDADNQAAYPSIQAAQEKINTNLKKTFDSAGKMADNLSNIINTTQTLSQTLGISIPKDIQKALNTASKITAGVKMASTIISGFASGGVLAAVGMIGSGPIGDMLGMGKGADPAVMESLGRIERKLDLVLENQQKLIEMQIETVKMIKNLAVIIDEYHQKEMMALADLRDLGLVNLEIGKALLNNNIRICEEMINFKLKVYWGNDSLRNGSTTTAIDYEKFYSQFGSIASFRNFAKSSAENNFSKCQEAFSEVFGGDSTNGSPVLSIFSTKENQNLYTFQRNKYLPLVKLLENFSGGNGFSKKILHMPTRQIMDLDTKTAELTTANSFGDGVSFSYNLENLISTKGLERYLSSLLILYPIFEFDKSDWNKTLPDLVSSYYTKLSSDFVSANENSSNVSRGYYFMNNALDMIHSSIAQEALLAGELIIPKIRTELAKFIFKNETCSNATTEALRDRLKRAGFDRSDDRDIICSIRENKLLMKNYLNYTIQKSISFVLTLDKYKEAFENADIDTLALYLNNEGVTKDMITKSSNGEMKIHLPFGIENVEFVDISLPTAKEVSSDVVVYSENMERLLKMQKDTISALVKLTPSKFRSSESREKFAQLLLFKNY